MKIALNIDKIEFFKNKLNPNETKAINEKPNIIHCKIINFSKSSFRKKNQ